VTPGTILDSLNCRRLTDYSAFFEDRHDIAQNQIAVLRFEITTLIAAAAGAVAASTLSAPNRYDTIRHDRRV